MKFDFDKLYTIIKGIPIFRELNDDEIKKIITNGILQNYENHSVVFDTSNFKNALMIILSGKVSVTKHSKEKTVLLKYLTKGEVFGVASLFGDESEYVATITSAQKTNILMIPFEVIREIIHTNGNFAENYIRFLTSKINFLNNQIDSFTGGDAESRVARYLLSLDKNQNGEVNLNVSLIKLSDMLDIGRASLYRALDELSRKEIISRKGKKISIINEKSLRDRIDNI